jgi:hypothetical protein
MVQDEMMRVGLSFVAKQALQQCGDGGEPDGRVHGTG